jgi:hypothetical protein
VLYGFGYRSESNCNVCPETARLLAKVPGDRYPSLRGREGETIRISWKEEDVQLLAP